MSADIVDEFHRDGDVEMEEALNNNIMNESLNNNTVDQSLNNNTVDQSLNTNTVDQVLNNNNVDQFVNNETNINPKSSNRKSSAIKKAEKEQKKEEKKNTYRKALKDLQDGKFRSINKCAKAYGVPASTLGDLHRSGGEWKGRGKTVTILTEDEEKKIVAYIRHQCKYGFGLSFFELRRLIQELAEGLKSANPTRKFPESWEKFLPEEHFAYNFAKRHLLTLRSTMELNKARSIITIEDLELWQSDTEGGLVNHPDFAECWTDGRRILNQVNFQIILFLVSGIH